MPGLTTAGYHLSLAIVSEMCARHLSITSWVALPRGVRKKVLPPKATFNIFFLAFFPGTPLYERAIKDGIIKEIEETSFRFYSSSGTKLRYQKNYETFLILLIKKLYTRFPTKIPEMLPFLRFLGRTPLRKVGSILPGFFYAGLSKLVSR